MRKDQWFVYPLMALVGFVLVWLLVRNWWLALFLVLVEALVFLACSGLADLIPRRSPDMTRPFSILVGIVAVGLLPSLTVLQRFRMETRRHGRFGALRRGLTFTGEPVNVAGVMMMLILAGALWTGGDWRLTVALLAGIVLNVVLVRGVLLPSFLALIWEDEREPPKVMRSERPVGQVVVRTS